VTLAMEEDKEEVSKYYKVLLVYFMVYIASSVDANG